ncbi:adenine phosphoribosyltransferase [Bariatricus massiliensis]|uniref:Adenine phosphoribosyltransferase n=1 Tax=Bariatricus massiliensis TaxID=1745713 RepID=A0ABS8DGQ9_9FIRM|nr:adenine phosphoribosyltransferase [Bariatricus massiliensis]MCB7303108.1 adenine phosphoribosyltransferase [Bariatricus massiliensis]MCB7374324.1 adenine phosphoribosyltransferase [Bariatricus massiliensis]MCB7386994.1 adenine phosphoribosyltransferase [Bariatricus massiliensis]MCB7411156.1 adenine phosphoribosyltransferase [Bariatricus massiliensis]MCQ5251982.1 adenine phosphoribosyltransferase [Bariatricus massiliensis]
MKKLEDYVVSIPDFPEEGIIFRDVTSILEDAKALHMAIDQLQEKIEDIDFDIVIGPESRGFIFGMPVAYNLNKAFVPVRKKGKLPCETASMTYELEYGVAEIEIHKRSIKPGDRVVIVDDLMATGGTIEAIIKLIEGLGGTVVKCVFLMELMGLNGRQKLEGYEVESIIQYPGN